MSFDRKARDGGRGNRAGLDAAAKPGKHTLTESLPQAGGEAAAPNVHAAAARGISGGASQLPFLDQIQRSFGPYNVGKIQAHTDAAAAEGAGAMGAGAFAMGDHVGFAGPPDLHTAAHEAAHVVQQRAGVQLKGGVGEAGDRYEQHADAVADLVVQGESAAALLETVAGPANTATAAAPAVQRGPNGGGKGKTDACNIPFPRVEYNTPNGTICRHFDGTVTYKDVTEARLAAAGYKFWVSDGQFDKWVRTDGSSELWVQLPKINAATSEKAIGQLRSIVATRRAQLDELTTLAKLMNSEDPEVAAEARREWDERMQEFPGFDDDYEQVPKLRDQVDADHRKAFEDQVKQLMEQRDRYDPQSTSP